MPNPMNLNPPEVSVTTGPSWATDINTILTDQVATHNHTDGQGNLITPAAMNINADVPMADNNLTQVRTVRFADQAAEVTEADDLSALYTANGELYYKDDLGQNVQITDNGSIANTSNGGINGLPSGTATAGYVNGTFTWRSSGVRYAGMANGPVEIFPDSDSPSFSATINAPTGLTASYDAYLPTALPSAKSFMSIDAAGQMKADIPTALGITSAMLAANAVTTVKITDSNVTTSKISASAVTTEKIADGAVTSAKRATLTKSQSGAISYVHPQNNAYELIADSTIYVTGSGRPIMILLKPVDGDAGFVMDGGVIGAQYGIRVAVTGDATANILNYEWIGLDSTQKLAPSIVCGIYNAISGTFTMKLATYDTDIVKCQLVAYEL